MIRSSLRLIGSLLAAIAFGALIVDATRSIVGERLLFFSLDETARWLAPGPYGALEEAAGGRGLGSWLARLADLPTWLSAGIAAALFGALGRRPGPRARARRGRR